MELALPRLAADGRLIAALTVGLPKEGRQNFSEPRFLSRVAFPNGQDVEP